MTKEVYFKTMSDFSSSNAVNQTVSGIVVIPLQSYTVAVILYIKLDKIIKRFQKGLIDYQLNSYQGCETHDHVMSLDKSLGAATLDFESCILSFSLFQKRKSTDKLEGHDSLVSLHWLICEIPSY